MTIPSGMRSRRVRVVPAIADGGTGERTAVEAAAALGVPSLGGDNTFTGSNTFNNGTTVAAGQLVAGSLYSLGSLQADGTVTFTNGLLTLGTDTITNSNGFAELALPAAIGTLAVVGDPVQVPYNAQGSTYAALSTDCVINCTGTFTVTLPAVSGVSGKMLWVKNSGVGTVTVDGNGAETIDGAATQAVAAGDCMQVCSDGLNWIIL